MTYAAGFSDGERDAFKDRQNGIRRTNAWQPIGEYQRGYWDAYRPGNSDWASRMPCGKPITNEHTTT